MGWFRRSRTPQPTESSRDDLLPVAVASAPALARTERALLMLAAQSAQLHSSVVALEHRVDALSNALLEEMERPSYDDLLAARTHSAKVAAELSRLETNVAARLDAVRHDIRILRGDADEIDLRPLTPVDSGWPLAAS